MMLQSALALGLIGQHHFAGYFTARYGNINTTHNDLLQNYWHFHHTPPERKGSGCFLIKRKDSAEWHGFAKMRCAFMAEFKATFL